jgi:protein-disulfide isomerase
MIARRAALALVLAFAACWTSAQPAREDDTAHRLAALERQLAEQRKEIDQVLDLLKQVNDSTLAARVDELQRKLDALANRAPPPPPPPPPPRPDPTAVYSIPIAGSPTLGSAKAKVTLVFVSDFACPYCERAFRLVDGLRKRYAADLRVVYKAFLVHPLARPAELAACAASLQNRYHEIAELLWTKAFASRDFSDANIDAIATEAKLDVARMHADVAGACAAQPDADTKLFQRLGINAIPTFYVNGRIATWDGTDAGMTKLIDEEIPKVTAALKRGIKAEKYYDQEVVAKGLTDLVAP